MQRKRLAVLSTHPIQYHSQWFRALATHPKIDLEVLYCHEATRKDQAAAGFGVEFDWDLSLLDGYKHRFLQNVRARPQLDGFRGLNTPEVRTIIANERFDCVLVNGWHYKSAWQAMRACWKTKTPLMVRSDSHLHSERQLGKRALKWPVYNWFIPRLDACLPAGEWSREYFLHYGAPAERIFIVPHAVDDEHFDAEARRWLSKRSDLRLQWGAEPDTVLFLFAGKFIERKRPLDFLRAIHEAAKQGTRVRGLMVGDGPMRQQCETLVAGNNLPVAFAGFLNQSEIAKGYIAADALVLPSDGAETWGLVVNEAMVCGRPCFVSDKVGCGPDLIKSGHTGEVFPLGDVSALTALMIRYASRSDELKKMGVYAREQIARFSTAAAVDGLIRALNAVTNGKQR